jgi:hypothetical protein
MRRFWTADAWTIHTRAFWHHHLARTGLVDVQHAEEVADGWRLWLDWAQAVDSSPWYCDMLRADAGRYLGYVGLVSTRIPGRPLAEYAWPATLRSMPGAYQREPLLRADADRK